MGEPSAVYLESVYDELIGLDISLDAAKLLCDENLQDIADAEHIGRRAPSTAEELAEKLEQSQLLHKQRESTAAQNIRNAAARERYSSYRILQGHVSDETAFIVDDYPSSYHLRCRQRHWIEVADKGSKEGQYRSAIQTSHKSFNGPYTTLLNDFLPKSERMPLAELPPEISSFPCHAWNAPKYSTYDDFRFLFVSEETKWQVSAAVLSKYWGPDQFLTFMNRWHVGKSECQLTPDQLRHCVFLEKGSRIINPESWKVFAASHPTFKGMTGQPLTGESG